MNGARAVAGVLSGCRSQGLFRWAFVEWAWGICAVVFFFSSRRRHTRYWRDWSSDVCSSDLGAAHGNFPICLEAAEMIEPHDVHLLHQGAEAGHPPGEAALAHRLPVVQRVAPQRSEERRVGKECRSRWSPGQSNKKISKTEYN